MADVYDCWEDAFSSGYDKQYCHENFLSSGVLHQLKNMRKQFMDLLYQHKFVHTKNIEARDVNRNSENLALVRAVITAGLYPNVARVMPTRKRMHAKSKKPPRIRTAQERSVMLHPKSVNEKEREFDHPWLIYREKIKSTRVFIHDSSVVANYPLLFFGEKLNYDAKEGVINIDGFVRVRSSEEVARLVQSLRNELDQLLEYKISHPGITQWNKSTKEGALLNTIVDLISSENTSAQDSSDGYYGYGDDDEDNDN